MRVCACMCVYVCLCIKLSIIDSINVGVYRNIIAREKSLFAEIDLFRNYCCQ
jgi:hypothetical protein